MSAPAREALGSLSPTVRSAIDTHPEQEVTAVELVSDILQLHGEYGDKRAARLRLVDAKSAVRRARAAWLADVRALFDATAAPVLHGRLVLVGLARLDPDVRTALEAGGFYDALVGEIREPLATLWAVSGGAESVGAGRVRPRRRTGRWRYGAHGASPARALREA
jgi:hypothetical protein